MIISYVLHFVSHFNIINGASIGYYIDAIDASFFEGGDMFEALWIAH